MRDYEQLRFAVQAFIDHIDPWLVPWKDWDVTYALKKALDETSTCSEMQRLVERLATNYAAANIRMPEEASATGKQYTQGYADALDEALSYIRTEFLGKEK